MCVGSGNALAASFVPALRRSASIEQWPRRFASHGERICLPTGRADTNGCVLVVGLELVERICRGHRRTEDNGGD